MAFVNESNFDSTGKRKQLRGRKHSSEDRQQDEQESKAGNV